MSQRHSALQESYSTLRNAIEVLCTGTEQDAVNVLRHMRAAQNREYVISLLYHNPAPSHRTSLLRSTERDTQPHTSSHIEQKFLLPLSKWTDVSDDDALLTHLFRLLWTWDTTLSRLIHRGLLIEAICTSRNGEGDSTDQLLLQFCSEALINAILAYTVV